VYINKFSIIIIIIIIKILISLITDY